MTTVPQHDVWAAPVRALLLDIDDTLVDTQGAMRGSCTVGAAAAWPDHTPEVHRAISDVFYDDPCGHFDAYTRGEMAFPEMRAARYHEACRRTGLPEQGFDVFEDAYRRAFATSQVLFDDVRPMLEAARGAGVAIVFVTNSGHEQTEVKLDAVGLRPYGPAVTTDTLGIGKPDPVIFLEALRLAGVDAGEAVVVGDTRPTDVEGGLAAGMRVAWLQRTGLPAPRNAQWDVPVEDPRVRVVRSLDEVTQLLASGS